MSGKENELREKWNAINYYSGGALKLSVKHPLEWYVRYATPEHKSVVILSQKAIKKCEYPSEGLNYNSDINNVRMWIILFLY